MDHQGFPTDVDEQIQQHLELSDIRVMCCWILNRLNHLLVKVFKLKRTSVKLRIVFFYVFVVTVAVSLNTLLGITYQGELAKIIPLATITTIIIATVKYLRNLLFPILINLAQEKIIDTQGKEDLLKWLNRYNNLPLQVFWSVLGALLTEILLVTAWLNSDFQLSPAVLFLLGVTVFIGVQLPYWTYAIVHAFSIISKYRIRIYALDPSEDPLLNLLTKVTMQTLLLGSLLVLAFALSTYWSFLRESPAILVRIAFIAWYLIGIGFAIVLFVMPSIYISRIIELEKRYILNQLQGKIEKMYKEMDLLDKDKLEQIEKALDVYQAIKNTPNTTVSWGTVRTFLASIGIQSLPVVTSFIDWQKVLSILSP